MRRLWWRWPAIAALAALLSAGVAAAGPYDEGIQAGKQALFRGDLRGAEDALRRAAGADASKSLPHRYLADIYARQKRFEDAVGEARRSLALEPDDGNAHYNLGMYLLRAAGMRPTDEVVSAFRRAVELDGRDAQAASNLGASLFLLKRYEEAIPYLQQATKVAPFWSPYWSNLGETLLTAGKVDAAIEAFAAAADPKRLGLLSGSAQREMYRATLGDIYLNWGKAEEQRGHLGQAVSYLRRVIDTLSKDAPSRGKVDDARRLLAQVERRIADQKAELRRHEQEIADKLAAERRQRDEELKRQQEEVRRQQQELARRQEEERKRQQEEAERKRREEELRVQGEALKRQEEELKRQRAEEDLKRKQQDTVPPVVTITDTGEGGVPAAGGIQSRDLTLVGTAEEAQTHTQLIAGVASDNVAVAQVTVAGKPAMLYQSRDLVVTEDLGFSTNFSADVTISPGENRIEVVATDRAGNQGKKVLILNATKGTFGDVLPTLTLAQPRKYALLVGVGRYESPEIPSRRFPAGDARALSQLLVDPKRGGFLPEDVALLADDQTDASRRPTREAVLAGLARLQQSAGPDDLVVVYYSGCVVSDRPSGAAYLLPSDTRLGDLKRTAISIDDLIESLARVKARSKVVFLDAGHGAGTGSGGVIPREAYERIAAAEGTVLLASCTGDEQPLEYPGGVQGTFGYFLCDGLTGKADADGNGSVTFGEVAGYVAKGVSEWAQREGRKQAPLAFPGDARVGVALSSVHEVDLERKRQRVAELFPDAEIRQFALSLLDAEPQSLAKSDQMAHDALEHLLRGEWPEEIFRQLYRDSKPPLGGKR